MTWKESLLGVPLAVLGAVMLLASGAGVAATHTDWGRAKLRSFLLGKVNASIQGRIEVDAFIEGDLLRSITLGGVEIYEPDGSLFARVDTVGVRYRWVDFLIGNIEVLEVRLVRPVVELRKPDDGDWNFERVFAPRGPSGPEPASDETSDEARTVVLREVRIRSGDLTLKFPWTPGPNETTESSRWRLEPADDGWWRVVRIEDLNATLPIARVAGPASLGRLFQISRLTGSVAVLRDPIEVEQLRAGIEQHGDTVSFDLWEGVFPRSHLFGGGWVTLSSPLDYDFTVTGTPLNTRDLRWLIPEIPLGLATLDYRMRSLPNGTVFSAYNANWESDQARLTGQFSMRTIAGPDRVAFDSVNLAIERLSTDLIPQLTGWEPPVEGTLSGRVALDGPLTRLLLASDVRFHPADGGAHSHLRAEGAAFVAGIDPGGQDLVVLMDSLSTDLIRAFVPDLRLQGVVSGELQMDGSLAGGLKVFADVEQRDPNLRPLRVRGGGDVLRVGVQPYRVDLRFQVEPLSFQTLSDYYQAIPLRGDYRGWFHLDGPLHDLDVEARLAGAGDSLVFEGHVSEVDEDDWAYRGVLRGKRAQIAFLGEGAAGSNLDFRIELEGQGLGLEQLQGRARVELYSSLIDGVRFDSAFAELRVADARLQLDTAVILSELGRVEAAGALGLRSNVVDSLAVRVEADSLSGLNRWLSPALDPLGPATLATNGEPAASVTPLRLSGRASATGFLVGNFHRLAALGTVEGDGLAYGDWTADSLRVEDLDLALLDEGLRASGSVRAAHAGLHDVQFESVSLTGEVIDRVAAADFKLANASGGSVAGRILAELGPELYTFELETFVAMLGRSSWTLERATRLQVARSGAVELGELRISSERGSIEAEGSVPESGRATFRLHVEGLDLEELATLQPRGPSMSGRLTVDAELAGRTRAPVLAGDLRIVDGELMDVPFSEILGTIHYEDGRLGGNLSMSQREAPLFTLRGDIPFVVGLPDFAFGIEQGPLNLRLQGDSIPLSLLELATREVEFSSGFARAAIDIGGTPDDVDLSGELIVVDGSGYVVPTGIGYHGVNGEAQFSGKTVQVTELRLAAGGGSGVITGTIELSEPRNPVFDLRLNARRLPAYDQFDARMVVSGQAQLGGPYDGARLTGRLSVVSGVLYIEEIGRRREIVKPFGEGLFLLDSVFAVQQGLTPISGNVFLDNLTIDQEIDVRRDTWLRSEEANIEIAGELSLRHSPAEEEFRIDGTLSALRGDYRLFNKRFALEEGEIEFVGTPALNPNIRLVAKHRVQTQKRPLEITVLIRGTLEEPKVKLESDAQPPIPESDLLSYLLFGRPTYEITRAGGEQGSLIEDVTAGVPEAFVGYALESLLVGETGIAYVDVSRAPVKGTQGFYSSSTAPVLAATQVEVGWYLAPTVFVSVAQHLSTVINIPTVRLEWKLNNNLTLQGVAEPRLARGTTVLTQNTGADLTETVGLFLFYGWTY